MGRKVSCLKICLENIIHGNCSLWTFYLLVIPLSVVTRLCNIWHLIILWDKKVIISPLFLHNLFFDQTTMISPIIKNSKVLKYPLMKKLLNLTMFKMKLVNRLKYCWKYYFKKPNLFNGKGTWLACNAC